jgi:hypothetical protein
MTTPLTDERRTEAALMSRYLRDHGQSPVADAINDLLVELDRIRQENERLTGQLAECWTLLAAIRHDSLANWWDRDADALLRRHGRLP